MSVNGDDIGARLTQLEEAVRRAADTLTRLREDNDRLRRDVRRLEDERRQVLGQVDAILKDLGKLDLGTG
jgi:FtsZ-binding cell division protein ZapB